LIPRGTVVLANIHFFSFQFEKISTTL